MNAPSLGGDASSPGGERTLIWGRVPLGELASPLGELAFIPDCSTNCSSILL